MGKRLTASEETALLRDTVRLAHEAIQELRQLLREAHSLIPRLISDFEDTHAREMSLLSNHMTEEGNQAAARLNAAVTTAREEILRQLAVSEIILDRETDTLKVYFPTGMFDDQVPPPYPHAKPAKEPQ